MIFAAESNTLYKLLIKPFLFSFDPERAHYLAINILKILFLIPGVKSITKALYNSPKGLEREVFGITFPNPVGLAAGFDKDAKMIDVLDAFGFGFIEIGTLTPKPQRGNPKPRLFRLTEDKALINRMGFNNGGVLEAVERLKKRKSKILVGGNIGKNKITSNQLAYQDYLHSMEALHDVVDYFVINISSPNTPGLRELQEKEPLLDLLSRLKDKMKSWEVKKPLLLKIAPDLTKDEVNDILEIVNICALDGIIVSNTTVSRDNLVSVEALKSETGGVSGKPVTKPSLELIRYIRNQVEDLPIIGVGGIFSAQDAIDKLEAGASLIQVYTGFIYEGPGMVQRINKGLLKESLKGNN